MMVQKFRKKPIVVEAYQLTEEKEIKTREGTVKGYPGDWIITGIQGEIYPCGKEIFEATYEPADKPGILQDLGKMLNSRIAKMEILHSKNPSPFRAGILEAYRDVEKWVVDRERNVSS